MRPVHCGERRFPRNASTLNVAVIRTGGVGDLVSTLPVLQSLRAIASVGGLCAIGHETTLSLAEALVDCIESIDRADWAPFFVASGQLPANRIAGLRETDLALSYLPDPDGRFAENLRKAGVRNAITHNPHPPKDGKVHVVDHLLKPLLDLGIEITSRVPKISVRHAERDDATRMLKAEPWVAIHPGSGGARKCWPAERFAQVADQIRQELGRRVILFSGPADGDKAMRVAHGMKTMPVVLHPHSLRLLAALFQQAELYLGNDSGPSHVAAAVGTPAIVLFGPTDPRVWGPRGKAVKILEGARHLDLHDRLASISERQVLEAIAQSLVP